jgi:hypothetical protein
MSTDLTTESSVYLSNNYEFSIWGPTLSQVSDYRLLGAFSFIFVSCLIELVVFSILIFIVCQLVLILIILPLIIV